MDIGYIDTVKDAEIIVIRDIQMNILQWSLKNFES